MRKRRFPTVRQYAANRDLTGSCTMDIWRRRAVDNGRRSTRGVVKGALGLLLAGNGNQFCVQPKATEMQARTSPSSPTRATAPPDRFLKRGEVSQITSLGRTTLQRLIAGGKFPCAIKIAGRAAWSENAVRAWMADKIAATPGAGGSA